MALVPYAALSYIWGTQLAKFKEAKALTKLHKTTKDLKDGEGKIIKKDGGNLTERRTLFSATQLPRTIRDVIKLTWDLGMRYIWIDAMCILPGTDWNDEASKMHEVYGNAYVTLAVCSSEMSTGGLLTKRQAWQYRRDRCRLQDNGCRIWIWVLTRSDYTRRYTRELGRCRRSAYHHVSYTLLDSDFTGLARMGNILRWAIVIHSDYWKVQIPSIGCDHPKRFWQLTAVKMKDVCTNNGWN